MYAQIDLTAVNPLKKIDRYYTVIVSYNLFGELSIQTVYGRNASKGQARIYTFSGYQNCVVKLNEIFKKRLNAKSRLGTNYHIVRKNTDKDFETTILKDLILAPSPE